MTDKIVESDRTPTRGVNPPPDNGWSWHLTEYEVAYIEAFNVRPVRDKTWILSPENEARLDQEADGVRRFKTKKSKPVIPWRGRTASIRWPWILAIVIALAVASVLTTLSIQNVLQVGHLADQTRSVNKEWR